MKELFTSITFKDLRWDFFRGSGKGGQKRNKTENCARCTHEPSGASGKAEDGRFKEQNKKTAFNRMSQSNELFLWAVAQLTQEKGHQRKISIEASPEQINIYDLGKYVPPKRKEVKRKPVPKNPHKVTRQEGKKITEDY